MLIPISLAALLVLCDSVCKNRQTYNRKVFCAIFGIAIFILVGLRDPNVGGDADQYQRLYAASSFESLSHFMHRFALSILPGSGFTEPLFELFFFKVPQLLGIGFQGSLLIQGAFEGFVISKAVYRYSDDCLVSALVYIGVFFSSFVIGAMRQSVALTLLVFIGYFFIERRQPLKFLLLVLVAYLIHRSSIVFAPIYFISKVRLSEVRILSLFLCSVCIYPIAQVLYPVISSMLAYGDFVYGYVGNSTVLYALLFILFALLLLVTFQRINRYEANGLVGTFVWSMLIVLYIIPFAFVNSNVLRAGWYYMAALIFLIPLELRGLSEGMRSFLKVGSILCVLFIFYLTADLVLPQSGYTFFFI